MQSRRSEERVKLVSFSGIDGSGKTTQIRALSARLKDEGVRVKVITFWEDVAQLTSLREGSGHRLFKGDKGVGTPEAPINRRDKNVRSGPMTCIRMFLYLLDTFALRRIVMKARDSRVHLIIFDRYIYDELANLSLNSGAARVYVRLIGKLLPEPDFSFVLDADPVAACARKPEYPLEFICLNRQSYLELSRLIGGMTIIPPMPAEDVEREVLSRIWTLIATNRSGTCVSACDVADIRHIAF